MENVLINTPLQNFSNTRSRYFKEPLTNADCTDVVSEVIKLKAYRSKYQQLDILLDSLLVECGINKVDREIEFPAVAFKFEESPLYILWDGQSISLNKKAHTTQEMTMSTSFKNIIQVTSADLDEKKQSSFLTRIKTKLNGVKDNLLVIEREGKTSIIFSGYAYHKRSSYPNYKKLNELALGIGVERGIINKNGNRETVSAMVFLDSHSDPEISISYELAKPIRIMEGVTAWAGINAGLTSRRDIMHHMPIPYIFPTLGLSVGKLSIRSILIPRLSKSGGNVLFLFGSYQISD